MATIRDALADDPKGTLKALGIDPDLPAEWATERRCRTWLREHGYRTTVTGHWSGEEVVAFIQSSPLTGNKPREFAAADSHAALIAACIAVREAAQ